MWLRCHALLVRRFGVQVFQFLMFHQYMHGMMRAALQAQNALVVAVFHKSLSIGPAAVQEATQGKITNLMSTDARKIGVFFTVSPASRGG